MSNTTKEIFTNQWEGLPFRESMLLTHKLALVIWHDERYIECFYQLAELVKTDENGKKHFKVISAFNYLSHAIEFLHTFNLDNYY